MGRSKRIIQAYRQAPWRTQIQVIGLFAALVVFIAVIAGVYLNVTARAATIGREIQEIQAEKELVQQQIEDAHSQLATYTSASVMEERAIELGFRPVLRDEVVYLVVPGYAGRQPADFAPSPAPLPAAGPELPPEFTMSLITWARGLVAQVAMQNGVQLQEFSP